MNIKQLPYSPEAEMSVLGSMLLDNDSIILALEKLQDNDFYIPQHQRIFKIITQLYKNEIPADIITVGQEYKKLTPVKEQEDIINLLTQIVESTPTTANIQYYISIVKNKSLLRQLIKIANEIIALGMNESEDISEILDKSAQLIFQLSQKTYSKDFKRISELVDNFIDKITASYDSDSINGLSTGFIHFDKLTGGLSPGELIILAARPSMGKTALALNIAQHISVIEKKAIAFFSLEMSSEQLLSRLISSLASVEMHQLKTGTLLDDQEDRDAIFDKISDAINIIENIDFYVDETPSSTVMEIRAKARRLKQKLQDKLSLIIIDYLQLINTSRKYENRNQEISDISRHLKAMAKELNVPVIALSQLSREVEKRADKRPLLSDLRESGAIEQEADLVLFIYREDYYNPETIDNQNIAEIIISKNRNGPTGTVKLYFRKEYTRFETLQIYEEDELI